MHLEWYQNCLGGRGLPVPTGRRSRREVGHSPKSRLLLLLDSHHFLSKLRPSAPIRETNKDIQSLRIPDPPTSNKY